MVNGIDGSIGIAHGKVACLESRGLMGCSKGAMVLLSDGCVEIGLQALRSHAGMLQVGQQVRDDAEGLFEHGEQGQAGKDHRGGELATQCDVG